MSERFGIPDHSPQHAPDHALQNPTSQGYDDGGGSGPAVPAPTYGGGAGLPAMIYVDPHKSLRVAIILAMMFGPLGLFYVSFLNGVAALFVVLPIARWLAFAAVDALGGRIQPVTAAIAALWCITVPWATIGTRWRNARIDREIADARAKVRPTSLRAASPSRPSRGSSRAS